MREVKAVLLCGGAGSRLREETHFRPKPMVLIGGKPILWHIMKIYAHYSITDFVVCVGYKGDVIRDYFLGYEARNRDFTVTLGRSSTVVLHDRHVEADWQVTVAETGPSTPTGGRLKRIARYLDDEPFMVSCGDGVADVDLKSSQVFHEQGGCLATLTAVQPRSRFGVVGVLADGAVERFVEKPSIEDWVNAGFFVVEPAFVDRLTDDCSIEDQLLHQLAAEGPLDAYRHEGFWQPMDTYRELQLLNELWEAGDAPWRVWSG